MPPVILRSLRHSLVAVLALGLSAAFALGAPPEVPTEKKAKVGQLVRISVKAGGEVGYQPAFSDDEAFFDELTPKDGQRRFVFQATKPGHYDIVFWTPSEKSGSRTRVVVETDGVQPDVDPKPPVPPDPTPVPPLPPTPAKSFYVVLIHESGKTFTPQQHTLFFGTKVEGWLRDKTTRDGEYPGYRRHDPDDAATGDTETMNALWGKVRAAITPTTVLPAVAVARDGKVVLEPLHKVDSAGNKTTLTPAELLALLDKYLQGK